VFAFHFWGHAGIKPVDDRLALVAPEQDKVVYLLPTPISAPPSGQAAVFLAERFNPAATIAYPGQNDGFRLYHVSSNEARNAMTLGLQPQNAVLNNGVAFRGSRILTENSGDRDLTLLLAWEVIAQDGRQGDQRFFNHLVDANGSQVAQWDGIGYPGWAWQPGDLVLSWHPLTLPPSAPSGRYSVRVGMYDSLTLKRTELRIDGQRPPDDDIVVGPVEINFGQ
jgi:hypothetical protein